MTANHDQDPESRPTIRTRIADFSPRWLRQAYVRVEHRAKIVARARRNNPSTTFLILAEQRTGSNLFESYLESHPEVETAGEILEPTARFPFEPRRRPSPRRGTWYVRDSVLALASSTVGARLMLHQLEDFGITVEMLAKSLPGAKIIVLFRRSSFDRYVSLSLARKTGRWTQTTGDTLPPPRRQSILVIREDFLRDHQEKVTAYRRLVKTLEEHFTDGYVVVAYEDLVMNAQDIFSFSVFPFLKLAPHPVSTDFLKQRTDPVDLVVENLSELSDLREVTLDLDSWRSGSGRTLGSSPP